MSDHFYQMPVKRGNNRNTFMRPAPARVLTTFNAGKLIPLWNREMLPGETIDIPFGFSVRSQTPIRPVFDDAYLDLFVFYCPDRLVLDSFEQVMGANKTGYWVDQTEHSIPVCKTAVGKTWLPGSVADYMGLDVLGGDTAGVNSLRFRMYSLIWNEYFRDQNTQSPAVCPTNDNDVTHPTALGGSPWQTAYKGGDLLPVNRLPDYFSTCTPGPLKANNVVSVGLDDVPVLDGVFDHVSTAVSPKWKYWDSDEKEFFGGYDPVRLVGSDSGTYEGSEETDGDNLYTSLVAKTSSVGISINDLRFAFQLQKLLERDLYGTRYTEILQSHFNVSAQDARLQRPELFGWRRYRLNQQQVAQTSATGDTGTPQGNVAAYSLTVGVSGNQNKIKVYSPEHGYVFVMGCIRVKHTYQQGNDRSWYRFGRYDFAWPEFVGLGNQPVYKREIYSGGGKSVFGYQEYAADYRYNRRFTTGQMRSGVSGTLDSWHYGDVYNSTPFLGSDWMQDNSKDLIDRTLAVTSEVADQFFGAFEFPIELTTWLPMYSIPGMIDHF